VVSVVGALARFGEALVGQRRQLGGRDLDHRPPPLGGGSSPASGVRPAARVTSAWRTTASEANSSAAGTVRSAGWSWPCTARVASTSNGVVAQATTWSPTARSRTTEVASSCTTRAVNPANSSRSPPSGTVSSGARSTGALIRCPRGGPRGRLAG